MSAFSDVVASVVAALQAAPAIAGGVVGANRLRPIPAGVGHAVVVRQEKASARETVLGALDWHTQIAVECYARAPTGSDPAQAIDALLQAVWERVAAIGASSSVMTVNSWPSIEWLLDDAETPVVCGVIRFTVQHRTPVNTLAAWP